MKKIHDNSRNQQDERYEINKMRKKNQCDKKDVIYVTKGEKRTKTIEFHQIYIRIDQGKYRKQMYRRRTRGRKRNICQWQRTRWLEKLQQ